MRKNRVLLLIPIFALIYFVFKRSDPLTFHHTKAVFKAKETVNEEFERIFTTSLNDFDFFYQLDFTAQRLRLLPKLTGAQLQKASATLFPWFESEEGKFHFGASQFDGTGVVMIVNNINAKKAYTTIQNLDESVQVELFYMGGSDLSTANFQLLNSTRVKPVDLFSKFPRLQHMLNRRDVVPFAVLASSFQHVVYLQVGSILFKTPETLSLFHGYQRYGVLFFKDAVTKFDEDYNYYHFSMAHLGALSNSDSMATNPFTEKESSAHQNPSIFMIDKVRGYRGLIAVCSFMITSAGKSKFLEAEAFWVVFDTIGAEYSFYPDYPKAIVDTANDRYTDYDTVYLDPEGQIFWISSGLRLLPKDTYTIDDSDSATLPSSLKLSGIKSIVKADNNQKAVVPFDVHLLTTKQSEKLLSAFKTSIHASNNFEKSRIQPKQTSPWSYKSIGCKPSTAKSAFNEWIAERIDFWHSLEEQFLMTKQKELYEYVHQLEKSTTPVKNYTGRGIIFSCHPGIIKNTIISIKIIREYGCKLPIQLWHMNELNTNHTKFLEKLEGVKVFNLANSSSAHFTAGDDDHKLYQVKAGALLYSSFEKILFLDSDNTPVRDPTFLFDSAPLKETGAIFWADLWKTRPDNPIFQILDIPCVDEYDQESGQIVIDKSFPRLTKALQLSLYFQERSELYYKLLLGDKDTFRLSWRLLSLPFHMVRPHMGTLGGKLNGKSFCGIAMAQYGPFWAPSTYGDYPDRYSEPTEPELLFVHANLLKYTKLGKERVFGTLKHYSPPAPLDGLGIFMDGPCISIADVPESKVITTKDILDDYEKLYRSITESVSKEVDSFLKSY